MADTDRLTRLYDERITEQNAQHPGYEAAWRTFERMVLAHGGTHVVPPVKPDPLLDFLREKGTLTTDAAELVDGDRSDCHRNAVRLWRQGAAAAIGTGYALSDDGLWREHSWGVESDGRVVETTEPRVAYFGVTMSGEGAEWFADWIEGD